jgi:RNA-dependent RNA polymerase
MKLMVVGLELAELHSKAVDYVKTGQPAEMPKRLRSYKWPHFMEKKYKPKDAIYHSEKILGQLYDSVERVSFVPQWKEPFDKRVLKAYKLNDATLKSARQIKRKYDAAMRRIMAQQDIETEFEVWSTFLLSRPRVGSDYKMQEVIGAISRALKDQFRAVCIEAAGSNDFSVLGPFVAAMYRVTKEELDIALAECRALKLAGEQGVPRRKMEADFMPLISFPWLFEKELGRIATGIDIDYDLDELGLRSLIINESAERQAGVEIEPDAVPCSPTPSNSSSDMNIRVMTPSSPELAGLPDPPPSQASGLAHDEIISSSLAANDSQPITILPPQMQVRNLHRLVNTDYTPDDSPIDDIRPSQAFVDSRLRDSQHIQTERNSEFGADEEIEEEEIIEEQIELEVEESPLERLARLVRS